MDSENPIRSILRTYGLIQLSLQPYFAKFGISPAQWGVLRALARLEKKQESVSLSDLSRHLLVQPPSVTGVIDRMERLGLIRRSVDPNDRRSRLVCLTKSGRQLLTIARKEAPSKLASLLEPLSKAEQKQLQRLLKKLTTHLKKEHSNE